MNHLKLVFAGFLICLVICIPGTIAYFFGIRFYDAIAATVLIPSFYALFYFVGKLWELRK